MTPRQAQILASIVETYAQTAEPVGSLALSQQMTYSPATIRAEMMALEQTGLITHPHTSAGRVPTDQGYRHYVNNLGTPATNRRIEYALTKRISGAGPADEAIKTAASSLSELTHNLGLATLSQGVFTAGLTQLFSQPEFSDHLAARQTYEVSRLLDSLDQWLVEAAPTGRVSVYIGAENPIGKSSGCSLIVSRFSSPYSDRSYIGVLGPTRQNYNQVIGLVDYASRILEEELV
ncbi:MAG TPA: transcriptional regulator [Candidatus Saccharimonadales bacterium]|nr:transcriptional regulator [Candidatus Saccharimonadales bacterium]